MAASIVQVATAKQVNSGVTPTTFLNPTNWGSNPGAGNTLLLAAPMFFSGTPPTLSSVTDGPGNTWSVLDNVNSGAGFNSNLSFAAAYAVLTGTTYTDTLNASAAALWAIMGIEVAGLTGSPADAAGTAIDNGAVTALTVTTSGSVSQADYVAVSCIGTEHGTDPSYTQPAGWTMAGTVTNSAGITGALAYRIVTGGALATVSAAWTYTPASSKAQGVIHIFKTASTTGFGSLLADSRNRLVN